MFVRNTFKHDNRVLREARCLIDQGFAVTVFAISNAQAPAGEALEGDIRVIRIPTPSAVSILNRRIRTFPSRTYRKWRRIVVGLLLRIVALIAPVFPPRRQRQALSLMRRAWPRLWKKPVPVVAPGTPAKPKVIEKTFLGKLMIPVHRFFQTLRFGNVAGEQAARLRPVAYHCHDLNSVWAGWRARRLWKAPLIYDSHELWPHRNRADASWSKTFVIHHADKYFASRADGVITVSPSIARHMETKYGVREVVVVRNTPPLALRQPPPPHANFTDLPRPRFLYLGGIVPNRGLEQIIRALPHTSRGVLIAMGPPRASYQAELEALAANLGVSDRVRFPGPVPEASVVASAAQCDVGLSLIQNYCLSYYYSLPNKLFEYLHAGLPVLVSDFPDMRQLVETHQAGTVCDPELPESIGHGMEELGKDLDRIADFKRNAVKAAQELSWEREQQKLLTLYRRLVPDQSWPQAGNGEPVLRSSPRALIQNGIAQ